MFKYTALIVEPRKHKAFSFVLHNFLDNLSEEWGFLIFHGSHNSEYVHTILDTLDPSQRSRIVNVFNLRIQNLNSASYSRLFVTPSLYQMIPTELFLVFQTDTMILNPSLLEQFLEYDYVGAPWHDNHLVGNGGLSLRKKSKMLEIIQQKPYTPHLNEDMYFSCYIPHTIQYHVPPFELAKQFSVETTFHDTPFGIHNCWKYVTSSTMDILYQKYPHVRTLIELQTSES